MPKWGWGVIHTLFSIKLPVYECKYVQHDFPRGTSYLNTRNYFLKATLSTVANTITVLINDALDQ